MTIRPKKIRRRGGAAVEMALLAPILVSLVLGMIESARLGMATQLLETAAREGCRVAVIDGKTQTDVQNRVDAVLSGSGISAGTVTPTPSNWASSSGGTAITVTISVPFTNVAWFSPVFFKTATLVGSATMSSERP